MGFGLGMRVHNLHAEKNHVRAGRLVTRIGTGPLLSPVSPQQPLRKLAVKLHKSCVVHRWSLPTRLVRHGDGDRLTCSRVKQGDGHRLA